MSPELESDRRNRERQREVKETDRESEDNKELQAAAALERADYLTREVKTSQNQMQNIVIHMQQVVAAIKKLRAELDLPTNEEASSVEEDGRRISKLKIQIQEYRSELESMREDLVNEQTQEIWKQHPDLLLVDATNLARQKVAELYAKLED